MLQAEKLDGFMRLAQSLEAALARAATSRRDARSDANANSIYAMKGLTERAFCELAV